MIAAWSAAVIAAAVVILVIGVLLGIRGAMNKLTTMQAGVDELGQELMGLAAEVRAVLVPASQTLQAASRQLGATGRLFDAAGQIGEAIEHTTSAVHHVTGAISKAAAKYSERSVAKLEETMDWAELGIAAWQLWHARRQASGAVSRSSEWSSQGEGQSNSRRNEGSE
ncbi:hypothetical protein ACFO9Q_17750 [Paenibacillus sp. GCM10023252]|uniref:hypothetical protein n=1 Tax=Paenibacillus sp. GCM10023252 TaxID=3252649 RepID=UPI003620A6CD